MKETKPKDKSVKKATKEKTAPLKPALKDEAKSEAKVIKKEAILIKKEMPQRDFTRSLGRRKRAAARVRLFPSGSGKIEVNDKDYASYFGVFKEKVVEPLKVVGKRTDFDFTVKVQGGGISGQAEAVSLGIARALIRFNEEYKIMLRKSGLLTRDPREKERKKFGLKRARHAPQWSKR